MASWLVIAVPLGWMSRDMNRVVRPLIGAHDQPMAHSADYLRGATYGLMAVCIWAAFIVVSRLGVTTTLTPWDVAAIRFSVAGSLLLPIVIRQGLAVDRLGWIGVAAI